MLKVEKIKYKKFSTTNHLETINYTYLGGRPRLFFRNKKNGGNFRFVGEIYVKLSQKANK